MIKLPYLLFSIFLFLAQTPSFAFPGMIRQGYLNCTSCHVSPSGGGVLNEYGRNLSGELLSTWSKDGEGQFLYGSLNQFIKNSADNKLLLGGDTRVIQTDVDQSQFSEKRFFLMQSDLEAAYQYHSLTFDLEGGYVDSDTFLSLRHYVMLALSDQDSLRFGKFKNNFGINTDEHNLATKNNLGWNEETETYNLEYSKLNDHWTLFATAIFGAPESIDVRRNLSIGSIGVVDHGGSIRASTFVADHYEFGLSIFYGKKALMPWRTVAGPFFILGFTPHLYYWGEIDLQSETDLGIFNSQRIVFEPIQGLQVYASQEFANPNHPSDKTLNLERYTLGIQFYPRPHSEIHLQASIEKDFYDPSHFYPLSSLLWHLYL